jgi:hypothetical protein
MSQHVLNMHATIIGIDPFDIAKRFASKHDEELFDGCFDPACEYPSMAEMEWLQFAYERNGFDKTQ